MWLHDFHPPLYDPSDFSEFMTLCSAKVMCDDRSVRNMQLFDSIFKTKHKSKT
jgi:hypothetical protein